VTYQYLTT